MEQEIFMIEKELENIEIKIKNLNKKIQTRSVKAEIKNLEESRYPLWTSLGALEECLGHCMEWDEECEGEEY